MLKKNIKFPPDSASWRIRRTSIFNGLIIAVIFLNFLFFSSPSLAGTKAEIDKQMQAVSNRPWGGGVPTPENSLAGIIQVAISAFLGLLGIIFIVLIIYAGFNWMTARGEEEKVTLAKETLVRAVIGLIIIIGAYSITYFVFSNLPGGGGNPLKAG
ncbi:MAG: pilin [bacterium]|nr:pilin [bacterium]